MQIFELILILVSSAYILFNRSVNKKLNKPYVVGLLAVILVLHLLFDGYRWQMVPGYIIWLIALITAFMQRERTSSVVLRILKITGLVVLLALSLTFPSLFPVFELPRPSGPYSVGTNDIQLVLDREEVITADKTDRRTIMIKAWYPSNETGGEEDPYIDKGGRHGFARKYGLPPSIFNYLDKIETYVYKDIRIAEGPFPVLIFSHGYNSKANGYYALLSEIVSHGYIVFAINHTYESTGTTFPDGTEVYFDYEYASQIESGTFETVEPTIQSFKDGLSFEERHPIVRKALTTYFVKDIIERWASDIRDVVSELNEWNQSGFYEGRLDLSNIGVFGHSRGGGAAGEALLTDSRIKAGANVDGVQWGRIVDTVFQQPFLFIAADWPADHENLNQHAYVNRSNSYFYESMIQQSAHSNFMDIPFMIPVKALSEAGEIDPGLAIEISARLITSFFDKYLKDEEVDPENLKSAYEALELKVYKGDSVDMRN